jgi:hypothetical protein
MLLGKQPPGGNGLGMKIGRQGIEYRISTFEAFKGHTPAISRSARGFRRTLHLVSLLDFPIDSL